MESIKTALRSPAMSQPERLPISTFGNDNDYEAEVRERWKAQYGVPAMFRSKGFADFDASRQPKGFAVCNDYATGSLVLMSPGIYGVGKTHLVCALANRLVETAPAVELSKTTGFEIAQRCPVRFETEGRLLARIRATYNNKSGSSEEDIYRELMMRQLLILDDVGKVQPKDYSFLQGVYFRVIDDRYTKNKAMILTTNLSLERLEEHIGGACADRLREMCGKAGFIGFTGSSYRGIK